MIYFVWIQIINQHTGGNNEINKGAGEMKFDWGKSKNERSIIDYQSKMVDLKEESFKKNISGELAGKIADIKKLESLISKDREIIELRKSISASVSSQLDNGVISSTEFLTEKNAETQSEPVFSAGIIKRRKKINWSCVRGI